MVLVGCQNLISVLAVQRSFRFFCRLAISKIVFHCGYFSAGFRSVTFYKWRFFLQQLARLFFGRNSFNFSAKFLACFALLANSRFFGLFIWRCCCFFLEKLVAGTTSGLFLTVWSAAYLVQVLKTHFWQFCAINFFCQKVVKCGKCFFLFSVTETFVRFCFSLWLIFSVLNIGFKAQNHFKVMGARRNRAEQRVHWIWLTPFSYG